MKNTKNTLKNKLSETYPLLNIIFAGLLFAVFIYSGIFSASKQNHPVKCIHYKMTGENCESCGLSRSFSEIISLNFETAKEYNHNGIAIFLFFLSQLFLRIMGMALYIKFYKYSKYIVLSDIVITVICFVYSFRNFIF